MYDPFPPLPVDGHRGSGQRQILGRLCRHQIGSGHGFSDGFVGGCSLDRIGQRNHGKGCCSALYQWLQDSVDQRCIDKRSNAIMDQHNIGCFLSKRFKTAEDRLLTSAPTIDRNKRLCHLHIGNGGLIEFMIIRVDHHAHGVNGGMREKYTKGVGQNGLAANRPVLLGAVFRTSCALASAGCDDNGGNGLRICHIVPVSRNPLGLRLLL